MQVNELRYCWTFSFRNIVKHWASRIFTSLNVADEEENQEFDPRKYGFDKHSLMNCRSHKWIEIRSQIMEIATASNCYKLKWSIHKISIGNHLNEWKVNELAKEYQEAWS
jgi:hypothetical protein